MRDSDFGFFGGHWRELQLMEPRLYTDPATEEPTRTTDSAYFSHFAINERAQRLLDRLVERLEQGSPIAVTYRKAFSLLSGETADLPPERSMACARWLVGFSTGTTSYYIDGLGEVRLDTFLVDGTTRRPSADHWARVDYEPMGWEMVFGRAKLWEYTDSLARAARRDTFF